jgi:hypothetical protein
METLQKEFVSDCEKIETMERTELENFVNTIVGFENVFDNLESSRNYSLLNWLKGFVKSENFNKMTDDERNEIFDQYDSLCYIIREVNNFVKRNRLGGYNY